MAAHANKKKPAAPKTAPWTFLSNHAHVLLCIAREPTILVRDLAASVGITERAVHKIVGELETAGYLVREREGRRNRYEVQRDLPLRHPVEEHRTVASLIELVQGADPPKSKSLKTR